MDSRTRFKSLIPGFEVRVDRRGAERRGKQMKGVERRALKWNGEER